MQGILGRPAGRLEPLGWFAGFTLVALASVFSGGLGSPAGALWSMLALSLGVAASIRLRLIAAMAASLFMGLAQIGFMVADGSAITGVDLLNLSFVGLFGLTTFGTAIGFGYQWRSAELAEHRGNMLRKIFNTLPIGIWVRDGEGRTVYLNERWASFAGRTADDILADGSGAPPVALSGDWEEEIEILLEADEGAVKHKEIELVDAAGKNCVVTLLTTRVFIDPLEDFGTLSLMVDETSLRHYEHQVRLSEHRLQCALNNAAIGFRDEDLENETVYADRNWFDILEAGPEERNDPLGSWARRLHPDDRKAVESAYGELKASPEKDMMEIEYRVRRGERGFIWVKDRVSVTARREDGSPVRIMGILHDISKRKEDEIELKVAKDRAEAASEAKGQFLATISHEIRTPLNAIIGLSSFLSESGLDEEQKDLARTIYSSGKSLLLLVNDILDFSKIEAGRLELETQEFPLRLSFEDSVKLFKLRASEKGVALKLDIAKDLPEYALGDMERLRQVVNNLMANALKFTEAGEVRLEVRRAVLDELPEGRRPDPCEPLGFLDQADHDYIEVTVRDTGIGIAPEHQTELFQAFSQADPSMTRKYGGTGLGLAICKRLVLAMGGRIWLDSRAGEGAAFGFVIRTKFIDEGAELESVTKKPFDPVERIAEHHPCDILVVGPPKKTEKLLLSCRKLGYTPHHVTDYDSGNGGYRGRFYDIVFIWIEAEAQALDLARAMRGRAAGKWVNTIVGVATDVGTKISPERRKLNGMEHIIGANPGPRAIREIILDVLHARG